MNERETEHSIPGRSPRRVEANAQRRAEYKFDPKVGDAVDKFCAAVSSNSEFRRVVALELVLTGEAFISRSDAVLFNPDVIEVIAPSAFMKEDPTYRYTGSRGLPQLGIGDGVLLPPKTFARDELLVIMTQLHPYHLRGSALLDRGAENLSAPRVIARIKDLLQRLGSIGK